MQTTSGRGGPSAQPRDAWFARLAFHLLQDVGPGWLTVWLVLVLGGLVGLVLVAGPWVPGAITAVSGLVAGGVAVAKLRSGRTVDTPPDPALDPPP